MKKVQKEAHYVPISSLKKANGDVAIVAQGKEYTPQEIAAAVLSKLKQSAENYLRPSSKTSCYYRTSLF